MFKSNLKCNVYYVEDKEQLLNYNAMPSKQLLDQPDEKKKRQSIFHLNNKTKVIIELITKSRTPAFKKTIISPEPMATPNQIVVKSTPQFDKETQKVTYTDKIYNVQWFFNKKKHQTVPESLVSAWLSERNLDLDDLIEQESIKKQFINFFEKTSQKQLNLSKGDKQINSIKDLSKIAQEIEKNNNCQSFWSTGFIDLGGTWIDKKTALTIVCRQPRPIFLFKPKTTIKFNEDIEIIGLRVFFRKEKIVVKEIEVIHRNSTKFLFDINRNIILPHNFNFSKKGTKGNKNYSGFIRYSSFSFPLAINNISLPKIFSIIGLEHEFYRDDNKIKSINVINYKSIPMAFKKFSEKYRRAIIFIKKQKPKLYKEITEFCNNQIDTNEEMSEQIFLIEMNFQELQHIAKSMEHNIKIHKNMLEEIEKFNNCLDEKALGEKLKDLVQDIDPIK